MLQRGATYGTMAAMSEPATPPPAVSNATSEGAAAPPAVAEAPPPAAPAFQLPADVQAKLDSIDGLQARLAEFEGRVPAPEAPPPSNDGYVLTQARESLGTDASADDVRAMASALEQTIAWEAQASQHRTNNTAEGRQKLADAERHARTNRRSMADIRRGVEQDRRSRAEAKANDGETEAVEADKGYTAASALARVPALLPATIAEDGYPAVAAAMTAGTFELKSVVANLPTTGTGQAVAQALHAALGMAESMLTAKAPPAVAAEAITGDPANTAPAPAGDSASGPAEHETSVENWEASLAAAMAN